MSCWPSRRPPPGGGGRASPARRGCSRASRPAAAAAFGPGMALDVLPGCAGLAVAADAAAGEDDRFAGRVRGGADRIVCAWDRVEAHAAARKLAAIAELARRNPAPWTRSSPPTSWPARWASPAAAPVTCWTWPTPGHPAARHAGRAARRDDLRRYKAGIIAAATALLDPDEARAAEAEVLDRASRLTPAGLRAAIARAVIEVAPGRRGSAARRRRSSPGWNGGRGYRQRRADGPRAPPGRGAGRGPEDHRLGARAEAAGWTAGWTSCARAYLDLLGKTPAPAAPSQPLSPAAPPGPPGGPTDRPLATLTGQPTPASSGLGPVDPWLPATWPPPPRDPRPPGA